ncbi:MAG: hypothetical protein WD669_10140 [Pirellulales bacterium]
MLANPVTREALERGIDKTFAARTSKRKSLSGEGEFDFDDALYRELEASKEEAGIDAQFWTFLVDTLWDWRAIRSKVEPNTKHAIRSRGVHQLPTLARYVSDILKKGNDSIATVQTLEWDDVEPLFVVAQSIKNATRPTFGSKLCHFLVPSAYFIWDH